jgi:carbon starvation protein
MWVLILFTYAGIASVLPVWLLLQPRDYINGMQLFVGARGDLRRRPLGNPTIVAPAFNTPRCRAGAPPLVPLLFVTIACGAISGFHGLVASGTTSKQLDKETGRRFVGYLGRGGRGHARARGDHRLHRGLRDAGRLERVSTAPSGRDGTRSSSAARIIIVNQGIGLPIAFSRRSSP